MSSLISIECAVGCVGRAIYGKEWISSLTDDEKRLIKEYVERPANSMAREPSSIMPGMITYMSLEGGNHQWEVYSGKLALDAEIKRALNKRKRMQLPNPQS